MSSSSSRTWVTRWAWPRASGGLRRSASGPWLAARRPTASLEVKALGAGLAGRFLGSELGAAAGRQLLERGPGLLEGLAQLPPVLGLEVPQGGGNGRKTALFPKSLRFGRPQLG